VDEDKVRAKPKPSQDRQPQVGEAVNVEPLPVSTRDQPDRGNDPNPISWMPNEPSVMAPTITVTSAADNAEQAAMLICPLPDCYRTNHYRSQRRSLSNPQNGWDRFWKDSRYSSISAGPKVGVHAAIPNALAAACKISARMSAEENQRRSSIARVSRAPVKTLGVPQQQHVDLHQRRAPFLRSTPSNGSTACIFVHPRWSKYHLQ
jgi:hypothetical protein